MYFWAPCALIFDFFLIITRYINQSFRAHFFWSWSILPFVLVVICEWIRYWAFFAARRTYVRKEKVLNSSIIARTFKLKYTKVHINARKWFTYARIFKNIFGYYTYDGYLCYQWLLLTCFGYFFFALEWHLAKFWPLI